MTKIDSQMHLDHEIQHGSMGISLIISLSGKKPGILRCAQKREFCVACLLTSPFIYDIHIVIFVL